MNDPTNFNADPSTQELPFKFASNEDAKEAARFFNGIQSRADLMERVIDELIQLGPAEGDFFEWLTVLAKVGKAPL
jgi:hypothetical protein